MMAALLFCAASIFASIFSLASAAPSCLDETGRPVDSWVALKAANSWDYYYLSGSTWKLSKFGLDGADGMIMQTAQQAYVANVGNVGIYNDEMVGVSVSSSKAHAKGILVSDAKQGFWLVHSMPKWPASGARARGPGPFDSNKYGQSLTCITVSAKTADTIAGNLMLENVYITNKKTSTTLSSIMPTFAKWLNGVSDSRQTATTQIKTLGGQTYYQMSKSASWGKDLWDDLVSPYFKVALYTETWRNGVGGRFSSICASPSGPKKNAYEVLQVETVTMPDGTEWSGTDDHSKWAVSQSGGAKSLYCIGGINRMCSQEKRGGGALCTQQAPGYTAFDKIVTKTEQCWAYNPCKLSGNDKCYWC